MIEADILRQIIDEINRIRQKVIELEQREGIIIPSADKPKISRSNRVLSVSSLQLADTDLAERSSTLNTPKIKIRKNNTATFFEQFYDSFQRAATFGICCERDIESGGINNPSRWIFRESQSGNYSNLRPVVFAVNAGDNNASTQSGLWLLKGPLYNSGNVGNTFNSVGGFITLMTALSDANDNSFSFWVRAGWSVISDETTKESIKPTAKTLGNLRPKLWKHKGSTKEELGFVAQEVEKELPEAVDISPDGLKGIKPDAILAAMVNTVQEMRSEIEQLKKEVARLKDELQKRNN